MARARAPRRPRGSGAPGSRTAPERRWLPVLLLVLLVAIAYHRTLDAGFLWDDEDYVLNNEVLRDGAGLARIWVEPRSIPQYYPLVHTVLWVEYQLWGLDPAGYHAVNILLHALSAGLLFGLLRRRLGFSTGVAWLAAAAFALHPVHVESVAWITELKNVLSGLFFFLALDRYLCFRPLARDESPGSRRDYLLALAFFLCALLAKTVTCSFPAVVLVLVWWKRGRIGREDLVRLLPFFAIGLALAGMTVHLEKTHVGAEGAAWDLSFLQRATVAGHALFFYVGKLLWPHPLVFVYPRWAVGPGVGPGLFWPLAALLVAAGLWALRHRLGRGPLAAALLFAGVLFPALGFFDVYPMRFTFVADHYQYLASVALLVLGVAAASRAVGHWTPPATGRWLGGALVVLLVGLVWQRTAAYHDLETLWRDTLAKNPTAWIAHHNLGYLLYTEGRLHEAEEHYRETLRLAPDYGVAHNNLGILLVRLGRTEEAAAQFEAAVRLFPEHARSRNNYGQALIDQGRWSEAIPQLEAAIERSTGYATPWANLGKVYLHLGRYQEAERAFAEALRIDPDQPDARLGSELVGRRLGRGGARGEQP